MIKEAKNVDFYTTGREPSELDFKRISEWIQLKKENKANRPATEKQYLVQTSK